MYVLKLIERSKESDEWEEFDLFLKSKEGVALIERFEREINVLLNRLQRLKEMKRQERRIEPYDTLQEKGHLLGHCLESNGPVVKEIKEQREWKKTSSVYENAVRRVEETIKELLEAVEEVEKNQELKEVPYDREDFSPPETYYGTHLRESGPYGSYHADVYTAKWRFEKDLHGIALPKLNYSLFGKKKVIVDAGCSTGLTTFAIKKRYARAEVIGIDLNEASLEKARKYFPKIEFKKGDFYRLSKLFGKGSVSIIFMGNNFSLGMKSMDKEKIQEAAEDIKKVLEEGGHWIAYDTFQAIVIKKEQGKLRIEERKEGEHSVEWPKKFIDIFEKAEKEC